MVSFLNKSSQTVLRTTPRTSIVFFFTVFGSFGVIFLLRLFFGSINIWQEVVFWVVAGIACSYWVVHRTIVTAETETTEQLQSIANKIQRITDDKEATFVLSSEAPQSLREINNATNALANRNAEAIEQMQRLQHVRSQFLGNVSHELRTPIFAIQGYLETLLNGALDDVTVSRRFVEKAYSNTQRLNTLLEDLIDISRIESGEMRMSFRYFDIADVIHDVVQAQSETSAKGSAVVITTIGLESDVSVFGDKERITQVLVNLITNAIKYNKPNGTVTIQCTKQQYETSITIHDTGIGIAPEHQTRVFERFYRVDSNRSRAVGGSGLGLAIVKHILEAHGSTITLLSNAGDGTTISFSLKN